MLIPRSPYLHLKCGPLATTYGKPFEVYTLINIRCSSQSSTRKLQVRLELEPSWIRDGRADSPLGPPIRGGGIITTDAEEKILSCLFLLRKEVGIHVWYVFYEEAKERSDGALLCQEVRSLFFLYLYKRSIVTQNERAWRYSSDEVPFNLKCTLQAADKRTGAVAFSKGIFQIKEGMVWNDVSKRLFSALFWYVL